jgi:hypothetical protein
MTLDGLGTQQGRSDAALAVYGLFIACDLIRVRRGQFVHCAEDPYNYPDEFAEVPMKNR